MPSQERCREVKRRHAAALLRQPGVSGVGVEKDATGEYGLTIYLDTDAPGDEQQFPAQIEGCPVRLVRSGPFRKFSQGSDSPLGG